MPHVFARQLGLEQRVVQARVCAQLKMRPVPTPPTRTMPPAFFIRLFPGVERLARRIVPPGAAMSSRRREAPLRYEEPPRGLSPAAEAGPQHRTFPSCIDIRRRMWCRWCRRMWLTNSAGFARLCSDNDAEVTPAEGVVRWRRMGACSACLDCGNGLPATARPQQVRLRECGVSGVSSLIVQTQC